MLDSEHHRQRPADAGTASDQTPSRHHRAAPAPGRGPPGRTAAPPARPAAARAGSRGRGRGRDHRRPPRPANEGDEVSGPRRQRPPAAESAAEPAAADARGDGEPGPAPHARAAARRRPPRRRCSFQAPARDVRRRGARRPSVRPRRPRATRKKAAASGAEPAATDAAQRPPATSAGTAADDAHARRPRRRTTRPAMRPAAPPAAPRRPRPRVAGPALTARPTARAGEPGAPSRPASDAERRRRPTTARRGDEDGAGHPPAPRAAAARARRRRRRGRGRAPSSTSASRATRARSGVGGDEVTAVRGSTRLEAKKQRRREGRDAGRRRPPILSEAEFLARREAVDRVMVVRQRGDLTQIARPRGRRPRRALRRQRRRSSTMVGNVYLGKVQNVLPSMEAAFVDIGRGRNAVLYAGEVNWDAAGLDGQPQAHRARAQVRRLGARPGDQGPDRPQGRRGSPATSPSPAGSWCTSRTAR